MTYPDLLLRPGARPVYRALCAAGPDGCTHDFIRDHAKLTGTMKNVSARNRAAIVDIRSALLAHGLTVKPLVSNKRDTVFRIADLDEPSVGPDYNDPYPVVAGYLTYQHDVGDGTKVRLRYIPFLHEVRA